MADQPEPPWWTELDPDWTEDDAYELVSLLACAYPSLAPLLPVFMATGFNVPAKLGNSTSPEGIWTTTLRHAVGEQQIDQLITVLLDDQWEKDPDSTLADFLENVAESKIGLERITSDNDEPADGLSYIEVHNQLVLRTAIISINGRASGSGCLIGDGLLLTCQHVVERSRGKLAVPSSIEVRFGFNHRRSTTYAETGQRVWVAGVICHSPPTDAERSHKKGMGWDADTDHLDYAILQLASPVPEVRTDGKPVARRHYPLFPAPYKFKTGDILTIAHHPRGQFIKFSHIFQAPKFDRNKTRIAYRCNTEPGSSGGPIVDTLGRLIALHNHASETDNNGIPISAIADDVKRKELDYILDGPDQENIVHLGRYTRHAREQVCRALNGDLSTVTRYLKIPSFIDDPYKLWDWLAKPNKLRKLRSALEASGLTELVQILDADQVIVDQAQIDQIDELAARIARSAAEAEAPSNFTVSMTRVRLLAEKLLNEIGMLPTFAGDDRLELQWRVAWNVKLDAASSALGDLSKALPAIGTQAHQAQRNTARVLKFARETQAAVTALHKLAESPALAA